ncbi:MAG: peptide-methionine (S)-S-oxide reductase MsrA [Candidatus Taylorbacteria bacterium]|nr:peptide-methionine (S)-S-oxide reductase MsrA [Candidatus Taylorbacteria bacterium]
MTLEEIAVFGGGCFWCAEAVFKMLKGVVSVAPGYAGGVSPDPTYEKVSGGETGHAEVIKIDFNPSEVSFKDLLTVFFGSHDPTTLNRQGGDSGTQYRSIILYTNDRQREEAEKFVAELNRSSQFGAPIVTEIRPLNAFYPAEEYHKDYYDRRITAPYCQIIINPKLEKVQKEFAYLLKSHGR